MRLLAIPLVLVLGCAHPALMGSGSSGADRVGSCDLVDPCSPGGGHAGAGVHIALVSALAGTIAFTIYRALSDG